MKRVKVEISWVDPFGQKHLDRFPTLKRARFLERTLKRNKIEYSLSKIED